MSDGNNRLRAWIEHYGPSAPPIPAREAFHPLTETGRDLFGRLSSFYGAGASAFLKMPVADAADYEKVQGTQVKAIYDATNAKGGSA